MSSALGSDAAPRAARVAAIGISTDAPCGVRAHAELLADALSTQNISCSLHWLSRNPGSMRAARSEVRSWVQRLAAELQSGRPDAVLLHYSVFAFAYRGIPVFAPLVLSAIRELRLPLVSVMHEYAYPWRLGGLRGKVWAASQRVALVDVMRSATGAVVTADARAAWLRTRVWLPRRATFVAPVFSNLPPPALGHTAAATSGGTLGLFGYAHEGVQAPIVLDAMRLLRERGSEVRLELLGAPGRSSPQSIGWEREAVARGLAGALSFSGTLPAQDLSDALYRCQVLLFAERGGPTSRKTTLAASLSSGRPVVALDGRNTWSELVQARAAVVVEPEARSLADAIARLLEDGDAREHQGERGRAFATRAISVGHSATVVAHALRLAVGEAAR